MHNGNNGNLRLFIYKMYYFINIQIIDHSGRSYSEGGGRQLTMSGLKTKV